MMPAVWSRLRAKLAHWRNAPIDFVREVIGAEPTWQQKQLLSLLPSGKNFAIRSGHGTGKSACLSWILMWFLLTHPASKVVCTAPSRRQLFDILWSEVYRWHSRARFKELVDILQIQTEVIRVGSRKDWFARAVAVSVQQSPEEQAELLAGYHADHVCVIVDEASGVPDPVFRPLETYSTTPSCKLLLAGNPTRLDGYFYNVFHSESLSSVWTKLHWDSTESPLVSPDWINEMKARYGEDSPEFLVRVRGEFPPASTERLIPVEWLRRAVYTEPPRISPEIPAIWGVDVAHQGSSETAIVSRRGCYVDLAKTRFGLTTLEVVDWILDEVKNYPHPIRAICIDCSGGWGVGPAELLRKTLGSKVIPVNFGWSSQLEEFTYLKDELWFAVRKAFEQGTLLIPPNEKLIRQLSSVQASQESATGRFRVETKRRMRARREPSPDLGDALALTFYLEPDTSFALAPSRPRQRHASSWRTV